MKLLQTEGINQLVNLLHYEMEINNVTMYTLVRKLSTMVLVALLRNSEAN